jgi:hypothetical protein
MAAVRRSFVALVVSLSAAIAGCNSEFDRAELDGRPCPCLPDWVCDESQGEAGICVREAALGAGAGGAGSDAGDAPSLAGGAGGVSASGAGGVSSCAPVAEPSGVACPSVCDECVLGTCLIRCDESRSCSGTGQARLTLECPAGFHCEVSCSSDDNCAHMNVQCAGGHACSVACTGKKSCNTLNMACAAGPCSLTCGAGTQICRGASELQCGTGACALACQGSETPSVTRCEDSCSSSCGC